MHAINTTNTLTPIHYTAGYILCAQFALHQVDVGQIDRVVGQVRDFVNA